MNIWLQTFIISIGAGIVVAVLIGLWNKGWPMISDAQRTKARRNEEWMNREIMLSIRYHSVSNYHVMWIFWWSIAYFLGGLMLTLLLLPMPKPGVVTPSPISQWFQFYFLFDPAQTRIPFPVALAIIVLSLYLMGISLNWTVKHRFVLQGSRHAILNMTEADQMLQSRRLEREVQARKKKAD